MELTELDARVELRTTRVDQTELAEQDARAEPAALRTTSAEHTGLKIPMTEQMTTTAEQMESKTPMADLA